MAKQVLYGRVKGNEIGFGTFDETVNLTNNLDDICRDLWETKECIEEDDEDEKIVYSVITYSKIPELIAKIDDAEEELLNELKEVRGNQKKEELLLRAKDFYLFKTLVIKMLLQNCDDQSKLLVLI